MLMYCEYTYKIRSIEDINRIIVTLVIVVCDFSDSKTHRNTQCIYE